MMKGKMMVCVGLLVGMVGVVWGQNATALVCADGQTMPGFNASCQGSKFEGVRIQDAKWRVINLEGSQFANVTIVNVDLTNALLRGSRWEGLSRVSNSILSDGKWQGTQVTGRLQFDQATVMMRIAMDGLLAPQGLLTFVSVNAAGCSITGARVAGWAASQSDFSQCLFSGSVFESFNFTGGKLISVRFDGTNISSGRFEGVDMTGTNFTGARFDMTEFINIQGGNVRFVGGTFIAAVIDGGNFKGANFQGADFRYATIRGDLTDADFTGADLSHADLTGLKSRNGKFLGANLMGANFSGSDVGMADFTGANVTDADFRGTKLDNATMQGLPENVTTVVPPPRQTFSPDTPAPTPTPTPTPTLTPTPTPTGAESSATPTPGDGATPLNPSASPEDFNDGSVCFPGDATVELDNGDHILMSKLSIGDRIRSSVTNQFDEVFFFGHKIHQGTFKFVEIKTKDGNAVSLSKKHLIWEATRGRLVPASRISVGDALLHSDGTASHVVDVSVVEKTGLYNPHTLSGEIVVNGFLASTYNAFAPPSLSHLLLWPERMAYRFGFTILGSAFQQDRPEMITFLMKQLNTMTW